jgi:hypothetical protein
MAMAFVDNGTLDLIVQHLDVERPYSWSTANVFGLSAMLIVGHHLCLAPGIGTTDHAIPDHCDWLAHRLLNEGLVDPLDTRVLAEHPECVRNSLQWVNEPANLGKLREAVEELHAGDSNYKQWIEWAMTRSLPGYSTRHDGLIEPLYLPAISQLLGMSKGEADALLKVSRNLGEVRRLFDRQSADFILLAKGYATSVMLRGMINDQLAQRRSFHIRQHPIKEHLLLQTDLASAERRVRSSNTTNFLVGEILRGAIAQRNIKGKVNVYVENIGKVRRVLANDPHRIDAKPDAHSAATEALRIAKDADLVIGDRRVDTVMSLMYSVLAGVVVNLVFKDFAPNVVAGVAAGMAADRSGLSHLTARSYHELARRFAKIPPGRISMDINDE